MATYNKSGTPQLQTSLLATIIYICLKHIEFVIVKFNKNSNTTQLMPAICFSAGIAMVIKDSQLFYEI